MKDNSSNTLAGPFFRQSEEKIGSDLLFFYLSMACFTLAGVTVFVMCCPSSYSVIQNYIYTLQNVNKNCRSKSFRALNVRSSFMFLSHSKTLQDNLIIKSRHGIYMEYILSRCEFVSKKIAYYIFLCLC